MSGFKYRGILRGESKVDKSELSFFLRFFFFTTTITTTLPISVQAQTNNKSNFGDLFENDHLYTLNLSRTKRGVKSVNLTNYKRTHPCCMDDTAV